LQQQQLHATYTGSNSNTTQQQHQQILLLNFNWFSAGVAATAMLPAAVESSAASRKKLSPCSLSGHLFLIEIALSFWSCMPLSFVFFKPPALFASLFCLVYSSAGVAAALLLLLACCKSFAGVDVDCGSNAGRGRGSGRGSDVGHFSLPSFRCRFQMSLVAQSARHANAPKNPKSQQQHRAATPATAATSSSSNTPPSSSNTGWQTNKQTSLCVSFPGLKLQPKVRSIRKIYIFIYHTYINPSNRTRLRLHKLISGHCVI